MVCQKKVKREALKNPTDKVSEVVTLKGERVAKGVDGPCGSKVEPRPLE